MTISLVEYVGVKKRIAELLAMHSVGLTMGEIIFKLNLDKTYSSDVSSALSKLRGQGIVSVTTGPAVAARGRRYVKKYRIVVKATAVKNNSTDIFLRTLGIGVLR